MKPFLQVVLACPGWSYLIIMKRRKGFFCLLLAFSLPRGEGSLTYGFQAWRKAKRLDFTYDQISGQP